MPLYTFECRYCKAQNDRVFKINDCPDRIDCAICGRDAKKIIVTGHGSIQCDSMIGVPWLASAVQNLQPDHERPVTTRGEYTAYLKEHGIIATG